MITGRFAALTPSSREKVIPSCAVSVMAEVHVYVSSSRVLTA